ncbi:hypothetical protein KEM52_001259 [Ascosphaera acerosa]|nr:hypothetical protein KEM52_001259 [Ascosphaera acerosa]
MGRMTYTTLPIHPQPSIPRPTDSDVHHYQCATVITNYTDGPRATTACLDTGCDTTVVSQKYLDEFVPRASIMVIPPLAVGGIGGSLTATRRADFTAWLTDKTGLNAYGLQVQAYVLPEVPRGLLLGTDCLTPVGAVINLARQEVAFHPYPDASVHLQVSNKPHHSVSRRVITTQRVVVEPFTHQALSVRVHGKKPPQSAGDAVNSIFKPCKTSPIGAYAALVGDDCKTILVANRTPHPILVPKNCKLSHIVNSEPYYAHQVADHAACVALREPAANRGLCLYDDDGKQPATPLENGVTIAGTPLQQIALEALVRRHEALWIDDGSPANIPRSQ